MKRKGCIETDFTFVEFKETTILCSIILQKEKKIKLLYESVLNKFSACGRTFCTSWIIFCEHIHSCCFLNILTKLYTCNETISKIYI